MTERLIDQKVDIAPITSVDIHKAISNIIDIKHLEFSKKSYIKIEKDLEPNLFSLINFDDITTILSNLINNSVEARRSNNKLTISITAKKSVDTIIIKIKDDGSGISPELINRIFTYGVTSKEQGKGCGLSHAKELLISWNGDILIESQINKFTDVTISLPLLTSTIKEIILIDDQTLNISSWKGMALKYKIPFKGYTNSLDFFENLPHNKTGTAIYVDYELGNENGLEIAQRIKEKGFTNVSLATGESMQINPNINQVGKEFPNIHSTGY